MQTNTTNSNVGFSELKEEISTRDPQSRQGQKIVAKYVAEARNAR